MLNILPLKMWLQLTIGDLHLVLYFDEFLYLQFCPNFWDAEQLPIWIEIWMLQKNVEDEIL